MSAYFFELTNLQENSLDGNTLRVNPILRIGLRPKFLDHTESEKLKHVGKQTINQSDKLTNISTNKTFVCHKFSDSRPKIYVPVGT
jgi:hypothetical protein